MFLEEQCGGLGRHRSHVGEELTEPSVVVDPGGVQLGVTGAQAPVDGLAVHLGAPVPVGAVQLGRVTLAGAGRLAASGEAWCQAALAM